VRVLDDPRRVVGAIRQALSGFGAAGPAGRHADLGETAAMLATRPELVRMERVTAGFQGEVGLGELLATGTRALSPSGTFGDPTSATAAMGAAVLAAWTQCLLDSLHEDPGACPGTGKEPARGSRRQDSVPAGLEGNGWHSPVGRKPTRSYSRRAAML
jgi:hypothetical protein